MIRYGESLGVSTANIEYTTISCWRDWGCPVSLNKEPWKINSTLKSYPTTSSGLEDEYRSRDMHVLNIGKMSWFLISFHEQTGIGR